MAMCYPYCKSLYLEGCIENCEIVMSMNSGCAAKLYRREKDNIGRTNKFKIAEFRLLIYLWRWRNDIADRITVNFYLTAATSVCQ